MKIKKLSKKLDFNVEAQARPCNRDCPSDIAYSGNTAFFKATDTPSPRVVHCRPYIIYSSFISKIW